MQSAAAAFVVAPLLGYAYFVVITSLSTVLQEHVDDDVRGRVMALWIMGFGGMVPLGVLAGGALANATSVSAVIVLGAVVALACVAIADLRLGRRARLTAPGHRRPTRPRGARRG